MQRDGHLWAGSKRGKAAMANSYAGMRATRECKRAIESRRCWGSEQVKVGVGESCKCLGRSGGRREVRR